MNHPAVTKSAAWTAAISVTAINSHVALVALSGAVAKEIFDLVNAHMHRTSVLAYARTIRPETSLRIGPSSTSPELSISNATPNFSQPDGEEGAAYVPNDEDLPSANRDSSPEAFCIRQRVDWLSYAMTLTGNWSDAEDAVSHAVEKIFQHYAEHGTACPDMRDPVGWSKTIIRNYVIDQWRRARTRDRYSRSDMIPDSDIADFVTDQLIAKSALAFVKSQDDKSHLIASMAIIDDLKPKEIAEKLGIEVNEVRRSLRKTKKTLRAQFGATEPRRILRGEKA
jgi:RNA polymerase sigma factor (sigma-70 family)